MVSRQPTQSLGDVFVGKIDSPLAVRMRAIDGEERIPHANTLSAVVEWAAHEAAAGALWNLNEH